MGVLATPREGLALYGLLADAGGDIIIKADRAGYVQQASSTIEALGVRLPEMLIGPHVSELADPGFAGELAEAHERCLAGARYLAPIEFPARGCAEEPVWFRIAMQPLLDRTARPYGTLGILRNVHRRRTLEDELFAASMTDPVTGLTNRQAFLSMLSHLADGGANGSLAFIDIAHFTARLIKHGHSHGDELLRVFADFLRVSLRRSDIISRIGDHRFAVLFTDSCAEEAREVAARVIASLGEVAAASGEPGDIPIAAHAGVAAIRSTPDATLRDAELALARARGQGGGAGQCASARSQDMLHRLLAR